MPDDQHLELYRAEHFPVFQNRMFATAEQAVACTSGDIVLVRDQRTGLVFNQAFNPDLMKYDSDYQNEQSLSTAFLAHLDNVVSVIKRNFSDSNLVELGCGKGYFLERLQSCGFDITGFDPAYEGSNPRIEKREFDVASGLSAHGIILRHVLEHIPSPVDFLESVKEANQGAGKIYIEVPCFDWICQRRAWFDIFYEHVNYFRLKDLVAMFGQVYEAGHLFSGQYLYVVADLGSLKQPVREESDDFAFPEDFLRGVSQCSEMIRAIAASGGLCGVWGGASKGVIFALLMQRCGVAVDCVVDVNPMKQGRYLASTGLQVSAPEQALERLPAGSVIFVMNGNYADEISAMTKGKYDLVVVDAIS
ncbi:MAG: class I SAM-dependent methyltransferase [Alcanivoracaceae bacterium]|nr:class I SAM-dependent methyltransferase [Alcanivoracaceae bacterium]